MAWCDSPSLLLGLAGCQREAFISQTDEAATWEASGTIRAAEIRVASELGGRIVAMPVGLGDRVGHGDVIARLDATPYTLQLGPAEAEIEKARAELAALKAGPRPEEIAAARAAVALAEAQRAGAREAWRQAEDALETPQSLTAEIISARTKIALAVQGVELAEAQLAQQQLARDQTPVGTTEREAADAQVRASEAALAAAQADEQTARALLSHLLAIEAEPLGLIAQANAAEGQYRVQAEAVAVAEAKLEDLLAGPTAEEIAVAEAAVRVAEAKAAQHRVQVEKCVVHSPLQSEKGTAVVIAQALRVGEIAAPAATILTLADLSDVTLDVYVPEPRIGHVMWEWMWTCASTASPMRSSWGAWCASRTSRSSRRGTSPPPRGGATPSTPSRCAWITPRACSSPACPPTRPSPAWRGREIRLGVLLKRVHQVESSSFSLL